MENQNSGIYIQTLKAGVPMEPIEYKKGEFVMDMQNYTVSTAEGFENKNLKPVTTWAKMRVGGNADPNIRKLTRIILDVINAYGFLPQSYISLEYKTKWYAGNGNRERVEQDPVTERAYKMFRTIRGIADFTPYRIRGRLAVKDKETGRVFK